MSNRQPHAGHWLAALGVALLALAAPPVCAVSIGNLRDIAPIQGAAPATAWELTTDTGARLRIDLLAADTLRLQAGPNGTLVPAGDKATPIVLPQPAVRIAATLEQDANEIRIRTNALELHIQRRPLRLALDRIEDGHATELWHELQPLDLDAAHTAQTLSSQPDEHFFGGGQQNGRFEFKGLELPIAYSGWEEGQQPSPAPMLLSSRGWGMLRNTWSDGNYDLRDPNAIILAHDEDRFDAYFFVGQGLHELLDRYTALTGRAGLLPRWAFGYGDSDCYNDGDNKDKPGTVPPGWSDGPTGKTPDVIDSVARKYREFDMPGSWILPNDGYGCGYTELPQVVKGLAQYGFRTGLWTENGLDKIAWEVGTAGTRVQKLDVAWTGKGYQFAMDANHAAYDGIYDHSDSRPFLWTVMGWAGIQRFAVAWTGDQSGTWDFIRWHIPTLIGSGLSGFAYANGDVDGIAGGSPETFTRDLQWKSFTPVLMGMSGWSLNERKHPWWFDEPYRSINRTYLKLKMRLTPYMYGLARDTARSGAPIVRGLMWDYPNDPQAFAETYKYEFLLGPDFLIAPVYRAQAASGGWRRGIHLPPGRWFDYWDGRQITAGAQGRDIDRQVDLATLPIFVRAGSIVPMYPPMLYDGEKPIDEVTFDLYPQGDSQYTLYEDDGNTRRYTNGEFSEQAIAMRAPEQGAGDVRVEIGAVQGQYAGQLPQRRYSLRVLARSQPATVTLDGRALPKLRSSAEFDAAHEGWYFDPAERGGSVHVRTAPVAIREALALDLAFPVAPDTADGVFPAAPDLGGVLPADALVVVNRPTEEPGFPLENAFDDNPATWFRTTRNGANHSGAPEWSIALGGRKWVDGIELAPRNDTNWKYGQVRDYEIYMADSNGEWGAPIATGRLKLAQGLQTIQFPPHAGRLLRFRVLSVHDPDGLAASTTDPMITAAQAAPARALDAQQPLEVGPVTLATFHVLEHREPTAPQRQQYLSELELPRTRAQPIARDTAYGGRVPMRMNGLQFRHGLGVAAQSRIDLSLEGDWRLFRADLGIDDSCRDAGGLQFQVWNGDQLLYDSGLMKPSVVAKAEIDVRGLHALSLRTLGGQSPHACGNWANAVLIGQDGDSARIATP